jgi:hypothetical protein
VSVRPYRLEHDDLHVLAMVNALGGDTDAETLNGALREDDDLRQSTFWRIFEVERSPRVNPAYLDRYRGEPGQGWEASIRALVADATLPREGVIQACTGPSGRVGPPLLHDHARPLAGVVVGAGHPAVAAGCAPLEAAWWRRTPRVSMIAGARVRDR